MAQQVVGQPNPGPPSSDRRYQLPLAREENLWVQAPEILEEPQGPPSSHIASIFSNSSFNQQVNECNNQALGPKSVPDFGKVNLLAAKHGEGKFAQHNLSKNLTATRDLHLLQKEQGPFLNTLQNTASDQLR